MEIRYFSVLAVFFLVFQSSAFVGGDRPSGTADPVLMPNLIESSLATESKQNILQGKRRKNMNPKKRLSVSESCRIRSTPMISECSEMKKVQASRSRLPIFQSAK